MKYKDLFESDDIIHQSKYDFNQKFYKADVKNIDIKLIKTYKDKTYKDEYFHFKGTGVLDGKSFIINCIAIADNNVLFIQTGINYKNEKIYDYMAKRYKYDDVVPGVAYNFSLKLFDKINQ